MGCVLVWCVAGVVCGWCGMWLVWYVAGVVCVLVCGVCWCGVWLVWCVLVCVLV